METLELPMVAEGLQVKDEGIQFGLADFIRVKHRHGPEPMSHLQANGEGGQRLIIEGWPEPGFSAGMTLMTVSHKRLAAFSHLGRRQRQGPNERFTAARRTTEYDRADHDEADKYDGSHTSSRRRARPCNFPQCSCAAAWFYGRLALSPWCSHLASLAQRHDTKVNNVQR